MMVQLYKKANPKIGTPDIYVLPSGYHTSNMDLVNRVETILQNNYNNSKPYIDAHKAHWLLLSDKRATAEREATIKRIEAAKKKSKKDDN